jgi:protoheme IX farnesyltransferase
MGVPVASVNAPASAEEALERARSSRVGVMPAAAARRAVGDFVELTKPRVVSMVLVTTLVGFYLGTWGAPDWWLLAATLIGTGLSAGGTLALNQYMERDADARMDRTRRRPLPSGRLAPLDALLFGAALTAAGLLILTLLVNPLSGLVTAMTAASYLGAYTPLKQRTPLCGVIGAIPGALPPVTGWVAATNEFGAGAGALFAILFLWQLPHSLAIAQLYAADYARAGFRLLPIVDHAGHSTERQIVLHSFALLAAGLAPTLLGIAGPLYFAVAFVLGLAFLAVAIAAALRPSAPSARRVMLASLVYLPMLLACMAWDKVTP